MTQIKVQMLSPEECLSMGEKHRTQGWEKSLKIRTLLYADGGPERAWEQGFGFSYEAVPEKVEFLEDVLEWKENPASEMAEKKRLGVVTAPPYRLKWANPAPAEPIMSVRSPTPEAVRAQLAATRGFANEKW